MKQIDSKPKQSLKARDIYQGTFIQIMVVGCVLVAVAPITIEIMLEWIGISNDIGSLGGGVGIGVIVLLAVAQNRAQRALERAGLLRVESEIIERAATTFEGETLEVWESSVWARLGFAALLLLVIAGCFWLWRDQFPTPFERLLIGAGVATCAWLVALILINIRRPDLRMDDRGISAYQLGAASKQIPWMRIASLHRKRTWGLPPDYSFDKKPTETVFLQDADGKAILSLHAGPLSGKMPAQKERFIAEIEWRLRAATPPQGEENLDG